MNMKSKIATTILLVIFWFSIGQSQTNSNLPAFVIKPLVDVLDVDPEGNPVSFFKRIAYRRIPGSTNTLSYYVTNMDTGFLVQKDGTSNDWWQNFQVGNQDIIYRFENDEFHNTIRISDFTRSSLMSLTSGQNRTGILDLGYCFNFFFEVNEGRTDSQVWDIYNTWNQGVQSVFKNMMNEMYDNFGYRIQILSSASDIVVDGADSQSVNTLVSNDRLYAGFTFFVELYNQQHPDAPLNVSMDPTSNLITGTHAYRFVTESAGITFHDVIDNELNVDQAIRFRLIP